MLGLLEILKIIDLPKGVNMNFVKWASNRLKEASTWRGLSMLFTALGIYIHPDLMEQIIVTGTGIAGLIGVITKDS